jgi:hypothetical protein
MRKLSLAGLGILLLAVSVSGSATTCSGTLVSSCSSSSVGATRGTCGGYYISTEYNGVMCENSTCAIQCGWKGGSCGDGGGDCTAP